MGGTGKGRGIESPEGAGGYEAGGGGAIVADEGDWANDTKENKISATAHGSSSQTYFFLILFTYRQKLKHHSIDRALRITTSTLASGVSE